MDGDIGCEGGKKGVIANESDILPKTQVTQSAKIPDGAKRDDEAAWPQPGGKLHVTCGLSAIV